MAASTHKKLVRDRQRYTNERYCQALAEIRSLDTSNTLIPETSLAQARFETDVLGRIGYGICPQDLTAGTRQPFGILSVVPRARELEISLGDCEDSLTEFLSKISPLLEDDESNFSGIPGLRVDFTNRGAVLRRMDADGRIVLRGISHEQWKTALVENYEDPSIMESSYLGAAPDLHPMERYYIDTYPSLHRDNTAAHLTALIMSGILRRIHMLRAQTQMHFTDLWFNFLGNRAVINIEWAGDLSHFDLIHRIADRRFGLPLKVYDHDGCYCEPCMDGIYSIDMRDSSNEYVVLHLRRSSLYDDHLPPRATGPCQLKQAGNSTSR